MARTGNSLAKPQRNAEATRAAILAAALNEFALDGVSGARTSEIARGAGVNKALLYYYFKDKEALYGAVLDHIFSGLQRKISAALDANTAPSARLLAYAGAHFDYAAAFPNYPRVVQWEMMRAGRGGQGHMEEMVKRYLKPIFKRLVALIEEGKRCGEFRPVDAEQFVPSMISVIVSYFVMRPSLALVMRADPLSPQRVMARRAAVLDQISHALFLPGCANRKFATLEAMLKSPPNGLKEGPLSAVKRRPKVKRK